jgi:hypothetical protein
LNLVIIAGRDTASKRAAALTRNDLRNRIMDVSTLPKMSVASKDKALCDVGLPFIVYAVKIGGRIVYIGRGSARRAYTSSLEKGGEYVILEAHGDENEAVRREAYWIECLAPEMNRTHGSRCSRANARGTNHHLPHEIQYPYHLEGDYVYFKGFVPKSAAHDFHAIASAVREFAGDDHSKARSIGQRVVDFIARGMAENPLTDPEKSHTP